MEHKKTPSRGLLVIVVLVLLLIGLGLVIYLYRGDLSSSASTTTAASPAKKLWLYPLADELSNWTPTPTQVAGKHYLNVDDRWVADDKDYIASTASTTAPGPLERFDFENTFPSTGRVQYVYVYVKGGCVSRTYPGQNCQLKISPKILADLPSPERSWDSTVTFTNLYVNGSQVKSMKIPGLLTAADVNKLKVQLQQVSSGSTYDNGLKVSQVYMTANYY